MVRVKEVQNHIKISVDDLEGLKCFHMFTFTHVLRLEKYPIRFHPPNAKTTFCIAPLLEGNALLFCFYFLALKINFVFFVCLFLKPVIVCVSRQRLRNHRLGFCEFDSSQERPQANAT